MKTIGIPEVNAKIFRRAAFIAGQVALKGVDRIDRKLMYLATELMGKKMKAPGPIHPKNLLKVMNADAAWFKDFLPQEGGKVLDLGAGSGSASYLAAKRGAQVTALERSPKNIEVIGSLKASLSDPSRLFIIQHDLEEFPYPIADGEYDAVVCNDVIEHLEQRQECLAECTRVLKPGGKLIITGPNRDTSYKRLRGKFRLPTVADDDHKIEYTRQEFLDELAQAGFKKCIYESNIVIDAPINGVLDMLGPISLSLYHQGSRLKHKFAGWFPKETTGFQMVFEKSSFEQ